MMRVISIGCLAVPLFLWLADGPTCEAGMPALLPTEWTADSTAPESTGGHRTVDESSWQMISFFIACLAFSALGVKVLWNSLRRDFTSLPRIGYGRSLSLVVLWGLCFVVVLTMISGARELMTPGAWRKQGWTYQLAETKPADGLEQRRQALERLRFALWQSAVTQEGRFPSEGDPAIDPKLWELPGWPGLRFLYVSGRSAEKSGRLLVFEPETNGDERLVLLTNGFLGSMRTAEIEKLLADSEGGPS